jgi:hypothetical protein
MLIERSGQFIKCRIHARCLIDTIRCCPKPRKPGSPLGWMIEQAVNIAAGNPATRAHRAVHPPIIEPQQGRCWPIGYTAVDLVSA